MKYLKLFLVFLILSLPFWWGINILQPNLEAVILANKLENNPPKFLIANISQKYPVLSLDITALNAISVKGNHIGFRKNEHEQVPVASLSKLMTAVIASEFYHLDNTIEISKVPKENGHLKAGEVFSIKDLLYVMLMESDNAAAIALAESMGKGFVSVMNLKAKDLNMNNTIFFDPAGLDDDDNQLFNLSSAKDLVSLTKYIINNDLIMDILSEAEYDLYLNNGILHHTVENTNKLLGNNNVIAGKTGYTEAAGQCLLTISKCNNEYVISIVLNSLDRFRDIEIILDHVNRKYKCN